MYKIVILLAIIFLFSYAGDYEDIDFKIDFEEAIEIGQIENKPTMVLITSKRCKWCKKLKTRTLSNDKIINRLNDKFTVVEVRRKQDDYPHKKLRARAVPTTYFVDFQGKPFMRPIIGYWNTENFSSYLDKAERKFKRLKK